MAQKQAKHFLEPEKEHKFKLESVAEWEWPRDSWARSWQRAQRCGSQVPAQLLGAGDSQASELMKEARVENIWIMVLYKLWT